MTTNGNATDDDETAVSEDELARLAGAWDEFIVAVRRARTRGGDRDDRLSLSQYEFVRPLMGGDGLPVSRLAEKFGIAPATATQILDSLERSGTITRSRSAQDRRTVTISLTTEGRRQAQRKRRSIATERRRLFESLAPEERAHTERLLRQLAGVISQV